MLEWILNGQENNSENVDQKPKREIEERNLKDSLSRKKGISQLAMRIGGIKTEILDMEVNDIRKLVRYAFFAFTN